MDLIDRVRATGLLAAETPVVVLLSGGRDSVCLLDVAVRLAGAGAVRALHVNYGLRDAAGDDEAFCRALCDQLAVALEVRVVQRPSDAGNLQAWARDVRLSAGARLALAHGARLATGHTASDQVETVLYRLAASPGRRALLGMSERDGLLVRPLLGVTRDETAEHCRARGLRWREDASNDDPGFARNRARAGLVPALRELHPSAERNVLRTAELLRDEAAVLDEVVDTALAAARPGAARGAAARRGRCRAPVCPRDRPARRDPRARRRCAGPRRRRPRGRARWRAERRADAAGALGAGGRAHARASAAMTRVTARSRHGVRRSSSRAVHAARPA
jgi:tRNA(Ile)-lysidine synthase